MFFKFNGKHNYLHSSIDKIETLSDFQDNDKIVLPLVVDTEFFDDKRKGITVQIKGIFENEGKIYCHQDFKKYCDNNNIKTRHKVLKEDFCVFDFLKDKGYLIKVIDNKKYLHEDNEKTLYIDLYSHFAIAELLLIVHNQLKIEFKDIIKKSGKKYKEIGLEIDKGNKLYINQNRRLQLSTKNYKGQFIEDSIMLPYYLILNGQEYIIKLRYFDTSGLHGISSYKNLAESVGLKLDFKDNLTISQKENMNITYFEDSENFDNYSLGDLEVYSILKNNSELFKQIYKSLNIENFYQHPKLTVGSTVTNIFVSKLLSHFSLENNDSNIKLIENLSIHGSANNLKKNINDTSCLLSKVFGGRCRNNRPLDHYRNDLLIDNDMDGCYGNGLRLQLYPLGKPIIDSYPLNTNNEYLTLRQWLKDRKYNTSENELVYGLWQCTVSSKTLLKHNQDFLASWFNFDVKSLKNLYPTQDDETDEINPKSGITKIFRKEVKDSVITDDFLDFLFFVCNERQRKELLDNLYVKSAIYYPSYSEVKTLNELIENLEDDTVKQNTDKNIKTVTVNHNTSWIRINIDKLIVDELIFNRKMYPKKTPLNTLYKLVINSLYGIFCSPFFKSSNTVVGNNITARARAFCWYMEKGHNMIFSITDGGIFQINKVTYPVRNKYLSASNCIDLYQYSDRDKDRIKNIKLSPLDNAKNITYDGEKAVIEYDNKKLILDENEFKSWINEKSLEHLQKVFSPKITVLNKITTELSIDKETKKRIYKEKKGGYNLEVKDIYKEGYFHGSANYLLIHHTDKDKDKLAFRSYQNKQHQSFKLEDNQLIKTEFYNNISPSKYFISQLNKEKISRGKVFIKKSILKVNEYSNSYVKFDNLNLCVGDSYYKTGLMREFSQSQITFNTIEQFTLIDKEIQRNKRKYSQSYEGLFSDKNGLLEYHLMLEKIDKIISNNGISVNKEIDKYYNRVRDKRYLKHSEQKCLDVLKEDLKVNKDNDKFKFDVVTNNELFYDYDELLENTVYVGEDFFD